MTIVSTMGSEKKDNQKANKNDRIYIRLNEQIKKDFEIVAAYQGLKTSALIHSLIVQTIHKAKEEKPEIFNIADESNTKNEPITENKTKTVSLKLSERLIAKKHAGNEKTFTTGDGKTFLLIDEGKNKK